MLVLLAGCGGATTAADDGDSGASNDDLDGRTFLSTSVAPRDLVAGSRIRFTFEDGSLSAGAGCNSMGADNVRVDGGRLVVSGGLFMTEMGCEEPLMAQDEWLLDVLASSPQITLGGDKLTLRAADGTLIELVDRRVADPDRSLTGTTWRLEGIISGTGPGGTVSSIPEGVTSTLRITDEGLELLEGCNSSGGKVKIRDGVLHVGALASTGTHCPDSQMRVDRAVNAVVHSGDVAYSIQAARLTLTRGDNGLIYQAR